MAASAPLAMAEFWARNPASRPMTSIKKIRSWLCAVTNLVNALHYGVEGSVITNCGVGSIKVVVDGSRQTNHGHIPFRGKNLRSGKRTVAAYDYQGIDSGSLHLLVGLLATFGSAESIASGGLQDSPSSLDGVRYAFGGEFLEFSAHKTLEAPVDTKDFHPVANCRTGNGANTRIHSGGITAGCQNANRINLCHNNTNIPIFVLAVSARTDKIIIFVCCVLPSGPEII